MAEIIILAVFGLIMTEVYARTRRPKLYAFLNAAVGVGSLILWQTLSGTINITAYSSALSAILGIPGTVLLYIMSVGG